jgi:hypothetical protein
MTDLNPSLFDDNPLEALIEQWFFESFHGSTVARSTEAWNVVYAAKEELKRRLVDRAAKTSNSPA